MYGHAMAYGRHADPEMTLGTDPRSDPRMVKAFAEFGMDGRQPALPRMARAVSSNPDAYVYLAESIRAWPDQPDLARDIADAGWSAVRWRNLTGGIVALHAATKPSH